MESREMVLLNLSAAQQWAHTDIEDRLADAVRGRRGVEKKLAEMYGNIHCIYTIVSGNYHNIVKQYAPIKKNI